MLIYTWIEEFLQSVQTLPIELHIHTDYDEQQIYEILNNCDFKETVWEQLLWDVHIYKTYSQDGNSKWMSVLSIDTAAKKTDDLRLLSAIIKEVEVYTLMM